MGVQYYVFICIWSSLTHNCHPNMETEQLLKIQQMNASLNATSYLHYVRKNRGFCEMIFFHWSKTMLMHQPQQRKMLRDVYPCIREGVKMKLLGEWELPRPLSWRKHAWWMYRWRSPSIFWKDCWWNLDDWWLNKLCSGGIAAKTNSMIYWLDSQQIRDSIVASIPACHAGDRGSIPRRGEYLLQIKFCHHDRTNVPKVGGRSSFPLILARRNFCHHTKSTLTFKSLPFPFWMSNDILLCCERDLDILSNGKNQ